MAKYAYAPLSIEDPRRKGGGDGGGGYRDERNSSGGGSGYYAGEDNDNDSRDDHLVQQRLPLCVGICVLLAIVYVLSRTGDRTDLIQSVNDHNANVRAGSASNNSHSHSKDVLGELQEEMEQSTAPVTAAVAAAATTTETATEASTAGLIRPEDCPPPAVPLPLPAECPPTTTTSTSSSTSPAITSDSISDKDAGELMAQLREKALSDTPPHIIECKEATAGETQAACHLPKRKRYASLGQKGATLWMTGCSGAGKTTIATALEELLVTKRGKHVYRLDGDNLRTGINRDLSFSESDRAESVRRTGEIATLFSDSGVITLVGLISPYRKDRDLVRQRHKDQGIPFYEIFLDVPISELEARDPKGQYKNVKEGKIKHFTCIDDPYEAPLNAEITLKTHELTIQQSVDILMKQLEYDGILLGAEKLEGYTKGTGLQNPDGDEIIDLLVDDVSEQERLLRLAKHELPKVLLSNVDLNWLQVIAEGWAAPLRGFMREGALLETLHFNSLLVDSYNVTGNSERLNSNTDFNEFPQFAARNRVSMSVPITLSITSFTKESIENRTLIGNNDVALVTELGNIIAILKDVEIYNHRKEEIVTRMYGVIDMDHPYIKHIYGGGDYLIGGEIQLLKRVTYNDGLDQWRKTTKELFAEFNAKKADTVYAFQTRNPTHAGHAYLMKQAGKNLVAQGGYKNPVLWLSPLGGWTKQDDVPLDVRVHQHEEVLNAGTSHPGGLDPETTVMSIWPAPMVYAGPTEVQFHAKSRKNAGASYFVVGRDPAGMKGSPNAVAHPDDDLYDGDHGRYVLQNAPGIANTMNLLSFVKVMYDISDNTMKVPDESRLEDFISISGTKMRLLARNGAHLCSPIDIPTDLVEANCIPSGFMVPKGWDLVVDYYKNVNDKERWTPWSKPIYKVPPTIHGDGGHSQRVSYDGIIGTTQFQLKSLDYDSWWHDIPYLIEGQADVINFIVEIPLHITAKMEVQKKMKNNVIAQDTNSDGSARYYTYGTPFFNYGLISQTWEDPHVCTEREGLGQVCGDNDPLDVIELGNTQLHMGSINPCRVIGSFELIDEGETDHKILCIALSNEHQQYIHTTADLDTYYPGKLNQLRDWLKRYKTSDGKKENTLASDIPKTVQEAMDVIAETHQRWRSLCGHDGAALSALSHAASEFWLDSPGCRGN